MIKIFILSLLLVSNVLTRPTTHDAEFEKQFKVTHIKEGDGRTFPRKNDVVHVHYEGTFLNGNKFDSSYDRNEPLEFELGVGQVIKCWDMAVERLSVGEKIKVICPYSLAYGEEGAGRVIPPNTDLVFTMELIKIGNTDL